ncbi:MAG: hypothetical protein Q8936_00680 [Bacillota bacterium]|nr:hypothetical protein [Bacillota bacterium]
MRKLVMILVCALVFGLTVGKSFAYIAYKVPKIAPTVSAINITNGSLGIDTSGSSNVWAYVSAQGYNPDFEVTYNNGTGVVSKYFDDSSDKTFLNSQSNTPYLDNIIGGEVLEKRDIKIQNSGNVTEKIIISSSSSQARSDSGTIKTPWTFSAFTSVKKYSTSGSYVDITPSAGTTSINIASLKPGEYILLNFQIQLTSKSQVDSVSGDSNINYNLTFQGIINVTATQENNPGMNTNGS